MYEELSKRITAFFIRKGIISNEKREIYEYSYEVLLSELACTLLILGIAIVSKMIMPSLFFFIGFFICRKIVGGYHASSYAKCHSLFLLNQISLILMVLYVPENIRWIFLLCMMSISILLIFIFAPMDHPNKPFNKQEYTKYKFQSRILILVLLLLSTIMVLINKNNMYYFCFSIGIFSASMSLLFSFVERRVTNEKVKRLFG